MVDISGVGGKPPINPSNPSGEDFSSPFQDQAKRVKDTTQELLKKGQPPKEKFGHEATHESGPNYIDRMSGG